MIWWALVACLIASLVLAGCAPLMVAALPPSVATITLTAGALSTSAATGFVLAVIGFRTIAAVPLVTAFGGWNLSVSGPALWAGFLAAGLPSCCWAVPGIPVVGRFTSCGARAGRVGP